MTHRFAILLIIALLVAGIAPAHAACCCVDMQQHSMDMDCHDVSDDTPSNSCSGDCNCPAMQVSHAVILLDGERPVVYSAALHELLVHVNLYSFINAIPTSPPKQFS